jgi:hypothetical protein
MKSAIDEASEAEAARRSYFRLLAFSEAPQGRLRRPGSIWNTEERVAARVLDLLRLIHVTIGTHGPAAAPFLAALTPEQIAGYHTALLAIGATKQTRLLGLLYRRLLEPFANVDPSQRQSLIAERLDDRDPLFWRVWYEIDSDELQQRLCDYLDAAPDQPLPPLPLHEAPHASRAAPPLTPPSTRQVDRGSGQHHLFLLRNNTAAESALGAWIRSQPRTRRYQEGHGELMASAPGSPQLDFDATARGPLFGVLRDKQSDSATPGHSSHRAETGRRDSPEQELLDALARNFHWVLIGWATLPGEQTLAWLSDDDDLAARFDALLSEYHDKALLGSHRSFNRLDDCARGLLFNEQDAFGEVALIAAEGQREAPWLVAAISERAGHWWRSASAGLPSLTWHWTWITDEDVVMVIYRGTDLDAWRALWSHIDKDDNIAAIAVGGELPLDVLRERLVHTKDFISTDSLQYLAGEESWAYGHVWGGGSDEHYAMFFARDPAVTARVAAFARERWPESWCRHGCW